MSEQGHSRIADARRRASSAKQRLGIAAAATFVAAFGLAWASHPGSTSSSSAATDTATNDESFSQTDDEFGGLESFGSVAPSGGATPQVQTHVS
jgi:hypothetical protein